MWVRCEAGHVSVAKVGQAGIVWCGAPHCLENATPTVPPRTGWRWTAFAWNFDETSEVFSSRRGALASLRRYHWNLTPYKDEGGTDPNAWYIGTYGVASVSRFALCAPCYKVGSYVPAAHVGDECDACHDYATA